MNPGGLFPKWIDAFDAWHVRLLPPILIGLGLAIVLLPRHTSVSGTGRTTVPLPVPPPSYPISTQAAVLPSIATNLGRRQPDLTLTMRPTRIESPTPNALFWRDRLGDIEGVAEPDSMVRLFLGDKLLSQTTVNPEGRFRFQLLHFPPGTYTVRVIATRGRLAQASEPVSFLVKAEHAPKPVTHVPKQKPVLPENPQVTPHKATKTTKPPAKKAPTQKH